MYSSPTRNETPFVACLSLTHIFVRKDTAVRLQVTATSLDAIYLSAAQQVGLLRDVLLSFY